MELEFAVIRLVDFYRKHRSSARTETVIKDSCAERAIKHQRHVPRCKTPISTKELCTVCDFCLLKNITWCKAGFNTSSESVAGGWAELVVMKVADFVTCHFYLLYNILKACLLRNCDWIHYKIMRKCQINVPDVLLELVHLLRLLLQPSCFIYSALNTEINSYRVKSWRCPGWNQFPFPPRLRQKGPSSHLVLTSST